ncbi:hypothetical protein C8R45DRAFT_1097170 [Mycena sanguinolenta]|nr:hypothetical protein C8R45DRAFT_1097170 [Mycena sanguinolenta]
MNFLAALLASFLAIAAANPVDRIAVREPAVLQCDILPFLNCTGGIDQQIACGDAWKCLANGPHPIISNEETSRDVEESSVPVLDKSA